MIRVQVTFTPNSGERNHGGIFQLSQLETRRDQRGPLPDDDERDDGAAVKPQVARTARAGHLWDEGDAITLPLRRHTFTRLSMEIAHDCGNKKGEVCGPALSPQSSRFLSTREICHQFHRSVFHQGLCPHVFILLHYDVIVL